MDKEFHPTLYWTCNYLSMLGKGTDGLSFPSGPCGCACLSMPLCQPYIVFDIILGDIYTYLHSTPFWNNECRDRYSYIIIYIIIGCYWYIFNNDIGNQRSASKGLLYKESLLRLIWLQLLSYCTCMGKVYFELVFAFIAIRHFISYRPRIRDGDALNQPFSFILTTARQPPD